jgi:hypothetical protein
VSEGNARRASACWRFSQGTSSMLVKSQVLPGDKFLLWYHLGFYVYWLATCHLQDKIFWNWSMPEKKPKWNNSIKQSCQIKYGNKLFKWQVAAMTSLKVTCKSTGNFCHLQDKTPLSETEMCLMMNVILKKFLLTTITSSRPFRWGKARRESFFYMPNKVWCASISVRMTCKSTGNLSSSSRHNFLKGRCLMISANNLFL